MGQWELVDLTLSDDEDTAPNNTTAATTAKKPRLENEDNSGGGNPAPLVPKTEKESTPEKAPPTSRCVPSVSPAVPSGGSGGSVRRNSNATSTSEGGGHSSVIKHTGGTSSGSSGAGGQNSNSSNGNKKVDQSTSISPPPTRLNSRTDSTATTATITSATAATIPPPKTTPSAVIPAPPSPSSLADRRASELGPNHKKNYLRNNCEQSSSSTTTSTTTIPTTAPPSTSIIPPTTHNISDTTPEGTQKVNETTPNRPEPAADPITPNTPPPSASKKSKFGIRISPVAKAAAAATIPLPSASPKTSTASTTPTTPIRIRPPSELMSPNTTTSEADTAPILEPQTEQSSSTTATSSGLRTAKPPKLTPEVPMQSVIQDTPTPTTTPSSPEDEPRGRLIMKFKIPKINQVNNNNGGASSSSSNARQRSRLGAAHSFMEAKARKLKEEMKDTKLFRRQLERVAHKREPADLKDTLKINDTLLRTVESLKQKLAVSHETSGHVLNNIFGNLSQQQQPQPTQSPTRVVAAVRVRLPKTSPSPRKGVRAVAGTGKQSNKTPEQLELLEEKFREIQEPRPSDLLELQDSTGLTKTQIQHWFSLRRKRVKEDDDDEMANPPLDRGFTTAFQETDGRGAAANHRVPDPVPGTSSGGSVRPRKHKFMKKWDIRSSDLDVLDADVKKIETCPFDWFKKVVWTMWNKKAHNIFVLVTTQKDARSTIMKEARRIKDKFRVDPFSEEQKEELTRWKETFLEKIKSEGEDNMADSLHTYEEYIAPWLTPFCYSRMTTQDGLYLTLEHALHDFSKLFDSGNTYKWTTPGIIAF